MCQGDAGIECGVLGMESGVTGRVKGAGRVIGALEWQVLETSGFWRLELAPIGGRFLGRFLSGSFRCLLSPVDGGVSALFDVMSTKTFSSSSWSTDVGV